MLRFLRIRQLAVIDEVEVEFGPGLNVLTGETGAGKSILVEAVGLLLGDRATGDLVRTGEAASTVEAAFDSDHGELLVRRDVTAQGRSRAFVNGALATATALRDLSVRLIELHGQHEHQTLLEPSSHVDVLDAFSGLGGTVSRTGAAFERLDTLRTELGRLRQAVWEREARQDLLAFQLGELERAAPKPGEDDELLAERQVLANAEHVVRLCAESYATLYESDGAILAGLGQVWRRVGELAELDPRFGVYVTARDDIKSQLEDLATFLRRYAEGVDRSPARLQQVDERLALLERLKRKYGPSMTDVLARLETLRRDRSDLEGGDDRLQQLERQHDAARAAYVEIAGELSAARRGAAGPFCRQLEAGLSELAMPRARVELRFGDTVPGGAESSWTSRGIDTAEFFISVNPGEDLRPLARIASGGELSRIMLAIKTLTATARHGFSDATDRAPCDSAPGLIFDEIDAGIGGRVADVVGGKLRALGSAFQVLCITHLPQIAAYADAHYRIDKRVSGGRTRTTVTCLDEAGRVDELSRMLGGATITPGVRASAREMLAERAKAKGERRKGRGR
jgi:DNA repair protein RecN (Recombination protein N)